MSYEGYEQYICQNGHAWTEGCYYADEDRFCPICKAKQACSRPLLDAASVEAGMGPHCRKKRRKKHGYYAEVSEESRAQANKIIHSIDKLVQALIKARATVQIEVLGDTLVRKQRKR